MLLRIDGWRACGKSVLWTLLDGHRDVFPSPIHDQFFEGFMAANNDARWMKGKDIRTLRALLGKTHYYYLELYSRNGFYTLALSASDQLRFPFEFDFYTFDRRFVSELLTLDEWSVDAIVSQFYAILRAEYLKVPATPLPKYYATMGGPYSRGNRRYAELLPDGKCIHVERDVEGIMGAICSREPLPGVHQSRTGYADSFDVRMKRSEVEQIHSFRDAFLSVQREYPKRFIEVGFRELVENTEKVMREVARFLEIEFDPILTKATWGGKELVSDGKKYTGKVNDDPAELLTDRERRRIRHRTKLYNIHRQEYYPFSTKGARVLLGKMVRRVL